MKVVVFSLGCKVNQVEGRSLVAAFEARGIDATDIPCRADAYIVNTCSVTAESDRKSRQAVARMLRYEPAAKVYVCGCSSQNDPKAFVDKPNVRIVTGVACKADLVDRVLADMCGEEEGAHAAVAPLPVSYEEMTPPEHTKTRVSIKIQDGCDNFCSYCIIPYLRGRSRSRRIESIASEAESAARVTKEIVLTGIDVSSFGKDTGERLTDLVRRLSPISVRKRLSSLECTVIDDELLYALRDGGFCDHFHLSLQSGSGSVLRRMHRKYTPAYYMAQIERIRDVFPHAGITTDIITGFCGETEAEFRETEDFVRAAAFSEIHVFPYSERKGTAAYGMPQIPVAERKARCVSLIEVGKKLHADFLARERGRTAEVYAETAVREGSEGLTSNYIRVISDLPVGTLGQVKLGEICGDGLCGEKV